MQTYSKLIMTQFRHSGREPRAFSDELFPEAKLTFGEHELDSVNRIKAFLNLDVDELLGHELTQEEQELLRRAKLFAEVPDQDTPNRRLAIAMLGLEKAVRKLSDSRGGTISDEQVVDTHDVRPILGTLETTPAGSDFGTFLTFSYDVPGRTDYRGHSHPATLHTLLPQDHYLMFTLSHGDPHEPVFLAQRPHLEGPEWSSEEHETLSDGGTAHRLAHHDRAMYADDGSYVPDPKQWRDDIYYKDRVTYNPLYRQRDDASVRGYVAILQELLGRFLDAAGKIEPQLTIDDIYARDAEARSGVGSPLDEGALALDLYTTYVLHNRNTES